MLAVNDARYNRFSSARAVESIIQKSFGVLESPEKVLEFFLSKRAGTLFYVEKKLTIFVVYCQIAGAGVHNTFPGSLHGCH